MICLFYFILNIYFLISLKELPDESRGQTQRCQNRPDEFRFQRAPVTADLGRLYRKGRRRSQSLF
jgi:hypothetical protein